MEILIILGGIVLFFYVSQWVIAGIVALWFRHQIKVAIRECELTDRGLWSERQRRSNRFHLVGYLVFFGSLGILASALSEFF